MSVDRLSRHSMGLIVGNHVKKRTRCIIKVYANHCKYCEALKGTYDSLVRLYPDFYFFAFNIADNPAIEKQLGFRGVPTILYVKTGPRGTLKIMPEPKKPDATMWYRQADIKKLIEENK